MPDGGGMTRTQAAGLDRHAITREWAGYQGAREVVFISAGRDNPLRMRVGLTFASLKLTRWDLMVDTYDAVRFSEVFQAFRGEKPIVVLYDAAFRKSAFGPPVWMRCMDIRRGAAPITVATPDAARDAPEAQIGGLNTLIVQEAADFADIDAFMMRRLLDRAAG